jgi:hypothetical protein
MDKKDIQKLIPTIFYYILSLIGIILLIIGAFNSIHFALGSTLYDKYPLRYNDESRCFFPPNDVSPQQVVQSRQECYANLESERIHTKYDDMEKSISFIIIGIAVYGLNFYFSKRMKDKKTK